MAVAGLVPAGNSPLLAAVTWFEQVLTGQIATAAAIVAIALVGFRMLSGDLSIRDGVRVVVGCFILFGAPLIARSFVASIRSDELAAAPPAKIQFPAPPPSSPPPTPPGPSSRSGNPFDPNSAGPQ